MQMIQEMLSLEFMRNAFLAGVLVALSCGVVGAFVVVNRIAGVAGGVAHASFGGIGLACFCGFSPMLGALGVALASAVLMGYLTWENRSRSDTLINVIWAGGMAAGVILTDLTPGYGGDLSSFLFGSILTVPGDLLWGMSFLTAFILILSSVFFRPFLAVSHDPEYARVRGVPVFWLYMLLMAMVACTVVMAVQTVGLILVIALLTIPAYVAERHSKSLKGMIFLSCAFSVVLSVAGLFIAYLLNWTVGPTIILFSVGLYALDSATRRILKRRT